MSRGKRVRRKLNQPITTALNLITPNLVLRAYASGVFPMAEDRDSDSLYWVDPDNRGIIPLDDFHLSKQLIKAIRQGRFRVTRDRAFEQAIRACAAPANGRNRTWINDQIVDLYTQLFEERSAHSIECWRDDRLVGGLYGVSLGGAFFGESMFHTARDASKVALAYLVAHLRAGGYQLLDIQFVTGHLQQFGAVEIPRAEYLTRLAKAISRQADFYSLDEDASAETVLQAITQTS